MFIKYFDSIEVAVELLKLGGRPVTVYNVTGVPRQRCIDMYKKFNKKNPPKGMLPHAPEWFINSEETRIQSSDLIGFYIKSWLFAQKKKVNDGSKQGLALLLAYQNYSKIYDKSNRRLTIDRAWILCRFYATNLIEYFLCDRCHCAFIRLADEAQYHCIACNGNSGECILLG